MSHWRGGGVMRRFKPPILAALLALVCLASPASAVRVDLSLNVSPTVAANPTGGGTWALYAKTDSTFGICGIDSFMTGISRNGITYAPGINAATNAGNPYVLGTTTVELVYFQDMSQPSLVVLGVGMPTFTPGPDPLGEPAWANATKIAQGTYPASASTPALISNGTFPTDSNCLSKNQQPFSANINADTFVTTRIGLFGDFEPDGDRDAADIDALLRAAQGLVPPALAKFDLNHDNVVNRTPDSPGSDADLWVRTLKQTEYGDTNLDGKVDVADLGALASHWQSAGTWATGDFNGTNTVDVADLGMLASHWQFGVSRGPSFEDAIASVGLPSVAVPEPSSVLVLLASASFLRRR
jgi:hypothetical protein